MIKRIIKAVVSFLLCFSIIFSLFGCYEPSRFNELANAVTLIKVHKTSIN